MGLSSRMRATMEFVVPRSMPIGRGGAFGSKISSRVMSVRELLFDGIELLEEATDVAKLAEKRHERAVRTARKACAKLVDHLRFTDAHAVGELVDDIEIALGLRFGELFADLQHLHQELRRRFRLGGLAHFHAAPAKQRFGAL